LNSLSKHLLSHGSNTPGSLLLGPLPCAAIGSEALLVHMAHEQHRVRLRPVMELSSLDIGLIHYLSRQFDLTVRNAFRCSILKIKSLSEMKCVS
jgi:hypothetical protein